MRNIVLIVFGFALYYLGFKNFEALMLFIDKAIHYSLASYFLTYIILGIPLFSVTCLINKDFNFIRHLGLHSGILKGLGIGVIFALPMFIGSAIQYKLAKNISIPNMLTKTLFAGLFEELYFRGYLFGQLFKKSKLGFLMSILLCSIIFASGHLYQSQDPFVLLGIFMTTFMGSVLFAWLYVEWNYNLWIPIFLHTLMNLSWYLFEVSDNALGSFNSNLFRGMTIALSIILTLNYKKRMGEKAIINKSTLLMKKNYQNN